LIDFRGDTRTPDDRLAMLVEVHLEPIFKRLPVAIRSAALAVAMTATTTHSAIDLGQTIAISL